MSEDYNYKKLSNKLISWYEVNARDLPWRHHSDPYIIWISEIILQQTTIRQGLDYYNKFVAAYPNVHALADASEDQVLKLWEGLGYYSRARNLHYTAQHISRELDGVFPATYKDLLKLKGVGPYTAAAIASFAYNLAHVVVDGNVIRFVSRLFGITKAVDLKPTLDEIQTKASHLLSYQEPSVFNQAIMEIGATCCTYKNPNCKECPVANFCVAKKNNIISSIPLKSKKIVKKKRFFYFFHVVDQGGQTIIQKRTDSDIWKGLYQFPLQEVVSFDVSPNISFLDIDTQDYDVKKSKLFKQTLTHQYINAQFIIIQLPHSIDKVDQESYILTDNSKLKEYAWPKIIDLYFKDLSITLF
jgi:A/G-specific adenine glycosylase